MSLNPLTIAHLGIGRRPIVAALLGIWDELMAALADARLEYHGGGKRKAEQDAQLHRDHWEYMDRLREGSARTSTRSSADPNRSRHSVQTTNASAAPVSGRAMRGTVETQKPQGLAEIMGNPLMLAALAVAIEEADD